MYDEARAHAIAAAASAAAGETVAPVEEPVVTALDYDAFLAHRAVQRLSGEVVAGDRRVAWSLIEKRTEGPELASPYLLDNGMRELSAYRSGLLADLPHAVRAPRLYGSHLDATGGITLWLEEVQHDGSRPLDAEAILAAARGLGEMNGRWLARASDEPWLFTGWIDRHSQPKAVAQGLATLRREHPPIVARLGDRLARAAMLVEQQGSLRTILESLPQTICHHDAVGANVFRDGAETVLIDWESVGPGAVGADVASLLFSSVRRGDAQAATVLGVSDSAVEAYAHGIREHSPSIDADAVRLGFDASIGLRWKLAADVVAGMESGSTPRRGSLPNEAPEAAEEELILLFDMLLSSAGRALEWI